ncbi:unnamed protein product [Lymnaea stagnalis]|uniref:Uncharacterized protein n=1 Tax=Lymnaea stagnalis TaxID=6523 RepID=A0AAV2GZ47_LYMST
MGKLLQVTGFPCETTAIQLVEFLKKIFPDDKLQNVWFDPYREPRAVAVFLNELDETRLHQFIQLHDVEFQDHILAFETTKPTWSIFVRTYGSVPYGTIDKLLLTFQKRPSRMVQYIQPLDDDCYEINFSGGWGE